MDNKYHMGRRVFWTSIALIIIGVLGLILVKNNPLVYLVCLATWDLFFWGMIAVGIPLAIGVCVYWLANKIKLKSRVICIFALCYAVAIAIMYSGRLIGIRALRYCCCDGRAWTGMGGGFLGIFLMAYGLYFALCITGAVVAHRKFIKNPVRDKFQAMKTQYDNMK